MDAESILNDSCVTDALPVSNVHIYKLLRWKKKEGH